MAMSPTFFCRLLLVAALGFALPAGHARTVDADAADAEFSASSPPAEQPASERPERNIFMSMLSRAQTADQLAALSFDLRFKQAAPSASFVHGFGAASKSAPPDTDGLLAMLAVAILIWFFSFRR